MTPGRIGSLKHRLDSAMAPMGHGDDQHPVAGGEHGVAAGDGDLVLPRHDTDQGAGGNWISLSGLLISSPRAGFSGTAAR
jgi:hypothetical protein